VEAKDNLVLALKAITAVKENFKADYIIDFLRGEDNDSIVAYKHDKLDEYGAGADVEANLWSAILQQAMVDGYIRKDVDNYGLLKITKEGKKFIKKPQSFMVAPSSDFDEDFDDMADTQNVAVADEALYSMLIDLRKKMSKKLDVPPYVIFQDASLEAMSTLYPVTLGELQNIPGVGAGKAKRYGTEFCELISRHCRDNEIERPADMRVRTVANKSKFKVSIVQSIDRKVALDDIAMVKGLDFSELLDEIETIVYSGTKLNIDYFIEDVMDEDVVEDIYEYFRESETDDLETAFENLDEDYTEDEIRLVRIKFISEMAN
jgi:ATP-dependent DNA helicase RecQ